jgi:hypothetical protein
MNEPGTADPGLGGLAHSDRIALFVPALRTLVQADHRVRL